MKAIIIDDEPLARHIVKEYLVATRILYWSLNAMMALKDLKPFSNTSLTLYFSISRCQKLMGLKCWN